MNQISYEDRKKVYMHALIAYGDTSQMIKCLEEFAECQKAICKIMFGGENFDHLAEEVADATIMLEQMRLLFNINDRVCEYMDAKVKRLDDNLNKIPMGMYITKEENNMTFETGTVENMTFGDALEAMKCGERVARKGWNGKGQYVFLAHEPDFVTDADISAYDQMEVEVCDVLVLKTAQDKFQVGWLATQTDMLAEDWYIVE